jgi:hypothetical protein
MAVKVGRSGLAGGTSHVDGAKSQKSSTLTSPWDVCSVTDIQLPSDQDRRPGHTPCRPHVRRLKATTPPLLPTFSKGLK